MTSVAHCKPLLTMGECVSAYSSLATVIPSTAHSLLHILSHGYRHDAGYSDKSSLTADVSLSIHIGSQLLLSLKLLPPLHSCRSSIVRVKRYSYCFVPPLPNIDTQHARLLYRSTFCAIAFLHSIPPVSVISR
jgi:hypothetical protein